MRTGTGSPLCENPALANFSGCWPASARWASDSPWPRLHQSPPPPSVPWHGKWLPGGRKRDRERERQSLVFETGCPKHITTPLPVSSGFAQFLPSREDHTGFARAFRPAAERRSLGPAAPGSRSAAVQFPHLPPLPCLLQPLMPRRTRTPLAQRLPGQPCWDTNTLLSQGTRVQWPRDCQPQGCVLEHCCQILFSATAPV